MLNVLDKLNMLYECDDFLLLDKPHNMPTVPLKHQDLEGTLLEQAAKVCPQVLEVKGKNPWEGGALHRLDTATAGIVLFAKNQNFYNRMQGLQEKNYFEKYYIASTCENNSLKGFDIEEKSGVITISSYFRPFGPGSKEVRATLEEKKASPKILYKTAVIRNENRFCCTITKGFRHQIRAHLAWVGHPIIGDNLYGLKDSRCDSRLDSDGVGDQIKTTNELQLECVGISLPLTLQQALPQPLAQSFGSTKFIKHKATSLTFPNLCNFANNNGSVIILP